MVANIPKLIEILPMLGTGLVGVFAVIATIWLSISVLAKIFK